ncbi:MAG: glycosyltransferase family 61 protein [Thermoanaerobaculia bacterium]|nr:glycosyltransferase family 61 protein [Thermoanaerobaculia bacterium]
MAEGVDVDVRGPGLETREAPWRPFEVPNPPATTARLKPERRLEAVTSRARRNVRSVAEVPSAAVQRRRLRSLMERPRTLRVGESGGPWFPQLEEVFLLQLRDAFVGDNVVFDSERHYSFGNWWLGDRGAAWRLYENTREVRHVEAAVSIAAWGGEAFQLFVLDALPKLASVLDLLEAPGMEHVRIVSHADAAATATWFWDRLGLSDRVTQKPKNAGAGFVIHADLVLAVHAGPSLGRYGLHPRHSLRPLQARLGCLDGGPRDRVIYLRRPNRNRSVANEAELLQGLRRRLEGTGLELVVFETPEGLDRDRRLFRRARMVLGPHGGAFANMIFAPPGTQIVEFLPIYRLYREGEDPRAAFWGLAQAAGHDYWTVAPSGYDHDAPGMRVDVEEVLAVVDRALRERGGWTAPAVGGGPG